MEDLTLKDCEGIFLKPDCMEIEILAAVAEHALVLYHQKKNRKEVPNKILSLPSCSLYSNIKKIPSWYEGRPNSEKKNFCLGGEESKFSMGKSDGALVRKSGNCGLKIADKVVANTVLPSGDNLRGKSLVVIKKKFPVPPGKHIESSTEETKISSRREKDPKGKRPMVYQEECYDDQDYQVPKKSRKINSSNNANGKKKKCISHGPAIPPPLPEAFKNRLRQLVGAVAEVTDPVLVIQKGLYPTDMSKGHNRVTIPFSGIRNEFLTEDESQELEKYDDNGKNVKKMEVNLIEPSREVRPVSLRRWAMRKDLDHASVSYVLAATWNNIVLCNHLVAGDVIQIWATRVDGKLWFILVRLTDNPGTSNAHSTAITSSSGSASD